MARWLWAAVLMWLASLVAVADENFIILQSTTSTENSGLFEAILPAFQTKTGIEVRVVAVGTGQAIRNAAEGNGDALLVHAKSAEEDFVAQGHGIERFDVMYNDFVFVGPADDPAEISTAGDALTALRRIAAAGTDFVSRGDDSGTHKAELGLWAAAGFDPMPVSGLWYKETGQGMGATLNIAMGLSGYAMTDRATWISFGNKGGHAILFEGDVRLFNQYGIMAVNPANHPRVKADQAQVFVDWMLSKEGQAMIAGHQINGQQLFFPNAK